MLKPHEEGVEAVDEIDEEEEDEEDDEEEDAEDREEASIRSRSGLGTRSKKCSSLGLFSSIQVGGRPSTSIICRSCSSWSGAKNVDLVQLAYLILVSK